VNGGSGIGYGTQKGGFRFSWGSDLRRISMVAGPTCATARLKEAAIRCEGFAMQAHPLATLGALGPRIV
jgi:hypothetical protein